MRRPSINATFFMASTFVAVLAVALAGDPTAADGAPAAAVADAPFMDDVEAAVALFRAKDFEQAAERFQRAHAAGAPSIVVFNLARCYQELERWEEARQAFADYLAFEDAAAGEGTSGAGDPDVRGRAEQALKSLDKRLATGTVVVQVTPFGASVFVDGAPVGYAPIEPLALPPGAHDVEIVLDGYTTARERVDVAGGRTAQLVVALVEAPLTTPDGPETGAAGATGGQSGDGPPPSAPDFSPWTWVTLGSGVAILAGGTAAYVLGEQDHTTITDAEGYGTDRSAQLSQSRALDLEASGDRKKVAGYVLWGVGSALVATSTVLFVLDATREEPESAGAIHVGFAPTVGGGFVSFGGGF